MIYEVGYHSRVVADSDELIAVPFVNGPLEGSIQHLLRKVALVEGAECWFPPEPSPGGERSADLKRATGHRYVLRVDNGQPMFVHEPGIKLINREDVSIGLNVMQGVYTIAIILGFRNALEAAYPAIVHPTQHGTAALGHPVLLLTLFTLMLLGLRFFWVTRNVYALVIDTPRDNAHNRLTNVVRVHFPITLLHAILFFVLCDTFKHLSEQSASTGPRPLVDQFVLFTALLLAVNGIWLLATFTKMFTKSGRTEQETEAARPAMTWGALNVVFALGAIAWMYLSRLTSLSMTWVLVIASAIFLVNSLLDLTFTAGSYIEFPGKPLAR